MYDYSLDGGEMGWLLIHTQQEILFAVCGEYCKAVLSKGKRDSKSSDIQHPTYGVLRTTAWYASRCVTKPWPAALSDLRTEGPEDP